MHYLLSVIGVIAQFQTTRARARSHTLQRTVLRRTCREGNAYCALHVLIVTRTYCAVHIVIVARNVLYASQRVTCCTGYITRNVPYVS